MFKVNNIQYLESQWHGTTARVKYVLISTVQPIPIVLKTALANAIFIGKSVHLVYYKFSSYGNKNIEKVEKLRLKISFKLC